MTPDQVLREVAGLLEWVRQGGSLRQIEDAGTVLDMQGDAIDFEYLERWARELGLTGLLEEIRPKTTIA